MINRRGLITGLISLAAAPAIVRASSLMPVKVMNNKITMHELMQIILKANEKVTLGMINNQVIYGSSVMRIKHDPNISDGIIFTSIRDILELD